MGVSVILVRDFAVDGMRVMLAQKQDTIAASFYGKIKTATQMISLSLLIASLSFEQDIIRITGSVLLYISLFLAVYSGLDYIIKGYNKHLK